MTTRKCDPVDAKGWGLRELADWLDDRNAVASSDTRAYLFGLARRGWTFKYNGVWSAEDFERSVRFVADDECLYTGCLRVAVMAQMVQDEWDEEDWARC